MEITKFIDSMSYFVLSGWHKAEKSYELFKKGKAKVAAVAYLNQANTFLQIANSNYKQHFEKGSFLEFEDFIFKFERFNDEMLDSYSTDHSAQHTIIYFEDLSRSYANLPSNFKTISG
ncbi:hypothetical protein ACOYX7_17230 [Enterococcus casseliflavus]